MNKFTLPILAGVFALATSLHSQAPGAARTPLQELQDIKAKNQLQIEKQSALLPKLEELEKNAHQLKFFGKRT